MKFLIIYDGNCNLCVSWVQLLEKIDRGNLFLYGPMQDRSILDQYGLTPEVLAQGMILIDLENPDRCWQGSTAIEEVARHLPKGEFLIALYRQAIAPILKLGTIVINYLVAALRLSFLLMPPTAVAPALFIPKLTPVRAKKTPNPQKVVTRWVFA
ncbi:MAG: thiol-disulfide oxidoreductase DCC family protein [Pseudanabaenaceae cyanobacterium]